MRMSLNLLRGLEALGAADLEWLDGRLPLEVEIEGKKEGRRGGRGGW